MVSLKYIPLLRGHTLEQARYNLITLILINKVMILKLTGILIIIIIILFLIFVILQLNSIESLQLDATTFSLWLFSPKLSSCDYVVSCSNGLPLNRMSGCPLASRGRATEMNRLMIHHNVVFDISKQNIGFPSSKTDLYGSTSTSI